MDLPYCIGWYNEQAIRIFEDPAGDPENPWKIVFEPLIVLNGGQLFPKEERERTLDAAKNTALALSMNVYHRQHPQTDIAWRLIRDA